MSSGTNQGWVDDLKDVCVQFQIDLSCLVDGELDEAAGGRAIAHLEECSVCRSFFDDTRTQLQAHRDLIDTDGLIDRYSTLVGGDFAHEIETVELVHRLATIFYQLGKSYVLNAIDPDFRTRVFEKAVQVGSAQTEGRGFVDGVLESGRGEIGGLDWSHARHMLNGRLSRIESPLEKGRRLLEEAIHADPTHEEARLYLAFLDARAGKRIRAAQEYRRIFRTAVDEANRAHAAIQLGNLLAEEGEFRRAIACNRWVTIRRLADAEERFFFVRFNIGMYYADLRDQERSLRAFRELLDRHPKRAPEVARLFLDSPRTRNVIELQPGFAERLLATCPELFAAPAGASDSKQGSEEEAS
jgi:tetratricopeptide (TPR) repeat protein